MTETTFNLFESAADVAKMATRLGNGIMNNSREVPGFIVNAVDLIRRTGDTRPMLTFLSKMSEKDCALVVKLAGKLSGVTNKGKARLVYKASENRLTWDKDFRSGTLCEFTRGVLENAHGKQDFRAKSISAALFPKVEKTEEAKLAAAEKAFKSKVKSFAESIEASDLDINAMRQMMLAEVEAAILSIRKAAQPAAA